VCSISITNDEYEQVKAGQLMMAACPICGKEVYIK
jgi:predicted  nucleic acid-binding Zn-ribbon protein